MCHKFNREVWLQYPELVNNPVLKRLVHQTWPTNPHWLAALLFLPALLFYLFKAPLQTWRYWVLGSKRFGWGVFKHFYQDAALVALKPNILHFEFGALAVGKTYLKELLNSKLSVSFRGYDLNYIGLNTPNYYYNLWETLDGAHFLGQDLWHRAQKRGAPQNLLHVLIPPALDPSQFPERSSRRNEALGSKDQPIKIISVGRLHWKKGYEFNLDAIKHLTDQGIHCEYRIIGAGDYEDALYYARYQLDLENTVSFYGSLPHKHVIKHLQWADVFLHGAVSEGFCNAVLEAQVMGLPVVCSDADGLPENVVDGVTGFVVPRRDPAAMAEKLALLASDGTLRRTMGRAGRKRVETNFRIEDQLSAFEKYYLSII